MSKDNGRGKRKRQSGTLQSQYKERNFVQFWKRNPVQQLLHTGHVVVNCPILDSLTAACLKTENKDNNIVVVKVT